jgi:hypothetical protein
VLRDGPGDGCRAASRLSNDRAELQSLSGRYALYGGDPGAAERMQRSLAVRNIASSAGKVCSVSFGYSNPLQAQRVLEEVLSRVGPVEVLDPPSLPEEAYWPNRLALVLTALLAGLLAGAAALAVRPRRQPLAAS